MNRSQVIVSQGKSGIRTARRHTIQVRTANFLGLLLHELCGCGRSRPRQTWRMRVAAAAFVGTGTLIWPSASHAQYVQTYFPSGVPGYDEEFGVTVLSRQRPLYEQAGVQAGSFITRMGLDESIGYNSNVLGTHSGPGSWVLQTSPSLSANSDWSRNSLGLNLTLDNYKYWNTSQQSHSDWTASIGGGYTVGSHDLTLAYSHLSLHQSPGEIGAVPSDTFVHYQVDDLRSDYTFDLGRFTFTPNVDAKVYHFDSTTEQGVFVGQQYRDRVVLSGGVTTRYALSDQRGLVFVLQGADSHFYQPQPMQPDYDSHSFLALGGIDYPASGVWRYQILAGWEVREFQAPQFQTHSAPIVEGSVIWTPTGLTTVTGLLSRTLEDTVAEGTAGYTYTNAQLKVDHELMRNVLLQGRAGLQIAQYLQSGATQTMVTFGGGVTWLMNRNMRLTANYDFTSQASGTSQQPVGMSNLATVSTESYERNLLLITLHFGL